jgi:toxin FitB
LTQYLLDTNVVSELRRSSPTKSVVDFVSTSPLAGLYISTVTFAEIRFGIASLADPVRKEKLELWLELFVRPMFTGRVLELSEDVLFRWRLLVGLGRKSGRTFPQPDLLLASTALQHRMVLVTRNTSDFAESGVEVLNP